MVITEQGQFTVEATLRPKHCGSCEARLLEGVIDDRRRWRIEIGFDRLKAVPTTNLHDDARVHLTIDQQTLGEPPTKIVRGDVSVVFITSFGGGALSSPFDDIADTALSEINQ